MIYIKIKRVYDFIFAFIGVILLFPLFLFITVMIKIDSKGPILFKQKRIGKYNKEFVIYKFRTMRVDTPKNTPTHLLSNPEKWITRVGKVLRKTSLDELPQFMNIIMGSMSFVGPRPALWNQYDLVEERTKRNIDTLVPGVTGWAQINGRDELSILEKTLLDYQYMERISLWFDVLIIIKTFFKVILSDGISEGKNSEDKKNEL